MVCPYAGDGDGFIPHVNSAIWQTVHNPRNRFVEEKPPLTKGPMGFIFSSIEKDWDDLSFLEKMISAPLMALMGAAVVGLMFAWMVFGGLWLIIAGCVILGPLYGLLVLWRKNRQPNDPD